jgi:H+/gluconate symporter-like permease
MPRDWTVYVETNPLRSAVGHHLAAALARIWLRACDQQSALLLTPAISVPALRAACGSGLTGLQKAAAIVLAAVPAVGMQMEQKVMDILRRLASQPTIV